MRRRADFPRRLISGWATAALALAACAHGSGGESAPDYRRALYYERVGPTPFEPRALANGPTVIIFFATWCLPCLGQLQYLAALQRERAEQGLHVVAVGMDLEGKRVLEPFAAAYAFPFPVLVADSALTNGESVFGRIRELPAVMIVAPDGRTTGAWTGFAEPADIRKAVDALIAEGK